MQIGGPTGAYIVIVYGIVVQYGVANLVVCTIAAGLLLLAMGVRIGGLIRFIPVSIVIGFTNGIAMLILLSQMKDFLGLDITMPEEFFTRMKTIAANVAQVDPVTVAVSTACLAVLWPGRRRSRRRARRSRRRTHVPAARRRSLRCATARSSTPCAADARS